MRIVNWRAVEARFPDLRRNFWGGELEHQVYVCLPYHWIFDLLPLSVYESRGYSDKALKFQRVLLNEDIAKRLTIRDVEAMIGIAEGELLRLVQGDDIESFAEADAPSDDPVLASGIPPHRSVDTRPIFDNGGDPLPVILDAAEELSVGMILMAFVSFHPLPLRRLLRGRGFSSSAWPEQDYWRVVFMRRPADHR